MKKIFALLVCLMATASLFGQNNWRWATLDTTYFSGSFSVSKHCVAGNGTRGLWCDKASDLTKYTLKEYDTAGHLLHTAAINGSFTIYNVQADNAGNWYLLLRVFDSVAFPGGLVMHDVADSTPFILCRLNGGTLGLGWAKRLGQSDAFTSYTFCISGGSIYIPVDSAMDYTNICTVDLSTGGQTFLWRQSGRSVVSAIAVDSHGGIYLAGGMAQTDIRFGTFNPVHTDAYDAYLVSYTSAGSYKWSYMMHDVTSALRSLHLGDDNLLYYSGAVNDSFSLGGHHFNRPAWVYKFMVAALDSNGSILWTKSPADTLAGDASVTDFNHAAVGADGSLYVATETRRTVNWGDGVVTNCNLGNATIVHFSRNGITQWAKTVSSDYSSANDIAPCGNGFLLTGYVYDTLQVAFDSIHLPLYGSNYIPYCARIAVSNTLAVTQMQRLNNLAVYPNPASDKLHITGLNADDSYTIVIASVDGKIVGRQNATHTSAYDINIGTLPAGLYLVQAMSATSNITLRFVKE